MHRAGGCAQGSGHRPPDGRAPRPVLPLGVARRSGRQREPHGVAEDPGLDDGLVRARADQLRRTVRGEDEQRHAGVRRLEHGRVQVRHGRARRRHDGHRPARPQREAQREEAGGPLVDPHVQPQPTGGVRGVQRERERGAAGAGAQDGVGDPAAHELVDDHLRMGRRGVHLTEVRPRPARPGRWHS